jgi:hypothetical protein
MYRSIIIDIGDHLQTPHNSSKADLLCSYPKVMSPLGSTTSIEIEYEITIFFSGQCLPRLVFGKNDL